VSAALPNPSSVVPASTRAEREAWLAAAPVLALLCLHAAFFAWTAPRGFDFTDESYYLLNFLHWRELTATPTFFGAYFEWPFRLLGQHVAAIRIFGFALLLLGGGFVAWRAMAFLRSADADGSRASMLPFVACGMGSALFYYCYATTLRAPSYNMLVLFCLMVGTGLLLDIVDGRGTRTRAGAAALFYGVLLGACALAKAHSAVAMVLCHGLFFVCFYRQRRAVELIGLATAGVAINFVLLHWLQPRWVEVLYEGAQATMMMDGRYAEMPLTVLWNAVLHGADRMLVLLIFVAVLFYAILRRWGQTQPLLLSGLVVVLVSGIVLTIQLPGYGKSWWALTVFGTALLWLADHVFRDVAADRVGIRRAIGLTGLLFSMPVAYSIGTNNELPAHTQMATVFGAVALMLPLRRLWMRHRIHWSGLACALTVLCLPTFMLQLRSLSDPAHTYRLRLGLLDQTRPTVVGATGDTLLVDALTRDSIDSLVRTMRDAGYRPGEPILDVTGDGPGLVYALGGKPVGVPWLIGGHPGSERAAARILNSVPSSALRRAWVISAPENRRALKSWAPTFLESTGGASHRLAGKVTFYPQQGAYGPMLQPVTLSLWKPVNLSPPGQSEGTP
jgi:hypothetical protein